MNKFVFVAMMTWSGLTAAAGLASGPAPHRAVHAPESAAHAAWTATWTCRHNTYRSVLCPVKLGLRESAHGQGGWLPVNPQDALFRGHPEAKRKPIVARAAMNPHPIRTARPQNP